MHLHQGLYCAVDAVFESCDLVFVDEFVFVEFKAGLNRRDLVLVSPQLVNDVSHSPTIFIERVQLLLKFELLLPVFFLRQLYLLDLALEHLRFFNGRLSILALPQKLLYKSL